MVKPSPSKHNAMLREDCPKLSTILLADSEWCFESLSCQTYRESQLTEPPVVANCPDGRYQALLCICCY